MKKTVAVLLTTAALTALTAPAFAEKRPMNPLIAPNPVIAPNPAAFTDVAEDAVYAQAVAYVQSKGLMNGTGEAAFSPEDQLTRAMLLTTLWRLEGSPVANDQMKYEDVDESAWYAEAVRWATVEKIVTEETAFRPDEALAREELCRMIYAYAQYKDKGFQGTWAFLLPYEDRGDMTEDAYEPVAWCVTSKILDTGDGVLLLPKELVTRGQAAVYLMRLCEVMK